MKLRFPPIALTVVLAVLFARTEASEWLPATTAFQPVTEPAFVPYYSETNEPDPADHRVAIRTDRHGISPSAAEVTFRGSAGQYGIVLHTIAEEDGESPYEILVNGRSLGRKTNPPTPQKRLRTALTFDSTTLAAGDKIRVIFAGASNEKIPENRGFAHARGRWRGLEIAKIP
ncbi:MAG: hypothetical protein PSV13_13315 [Lacunisphaera sp.]|nr:hypothetical protein [Lacunisphaera sp.]